MRVLPEVPPRGRLDRLLDWFAYEWPTDRFFARLRTWWYWHCSREGAQRIREARAVDDVVALVDPFWAELERVRIEMAIKRRDGWFDVPERWRR